MRKKIIINADDLGLSRSVNEAIFEVYKAGNLTSATLMVDMPGTEHAALGAAGHPSLSLGLHFCITEGKALVGTSSITDAHGHFLERSVLIRKAIRGELFVDHIRREFLAQLGRMADLGVSPSHVDSHQHVHMLPVVFEAMAPVLAERELPVRCVDPPIRTVVGSLSRPKKALKQWMNKRFAARLRSVHPGRTNDVLVSIHDLDQVGPYDAHIYRMLIGMAPPGKVVELMVHPYRNGKDVLDLYSAQLGKKKPFLERCFAEYNALVSGTLFPDEELINYRNI